MPSIAPRWFQPVDHSPDGSAAATTRGLRSTPGHPLVLLAADAIAQFVTVRQLIHPPQRLLQVMPEASRPGAAFVCLKIDAQLRGCIGTVQAVRDSLALEVIHNAIAAATRDPRFRPVQAWEADRLSITVDVIGVSEPIETLQQLDPERYGIVVRCGHRQGVLLPAVEEIRTPDEQLTVACEKAGISRNESMELFRFVVTRFQ